MCSITRERSEISSRSSICLHVVRHRFTLIDVQRDRFIILPWHIYIYTGRQWLLQIYHGEYKYKIYKNSLYDGKKKQWNTDILIFCVSRKFTWSLCFEYFCIIYLSLYIPLYVVIGNFMQMWFNTRKYERISVFTEWFIGLNKSLVTARAINDRLRKYYHQALHRAEGWDQL